MSGSDARVAGGRDGLLGRLMAAGRTEFRGDTLIFAADDPVFGGDVGRIAGCARTVRGRGLCQGHRHRWVNAGSPDLDVFAATTDPRWQRQKPNMRCRVTGCGYGAARQGMCGSHAQRWERGGRPDQETWLADPPAVKPPAPDASCRIDHCELWPQASLPFCQSHAKTWKTNGLPNIEEFVSRFDHIQNTDEQSVYLARLPAGLRLEIQYALQCRHDERCTKTPPAVVMQVVRFLAAASAVSLLDRPEETWRAQIGRPAPKDSNPRALLIYARRKVEDLLESDGWDAEYRRDIWRLRRLGFTGDRMLRFTEIPQPGLKDLAKRWVRSRLAGGLGLEAAAGRPLRVITRFARFLDAAGIDSIDRIDRPLLERYLADLHAEMAGTASHRTHIGLLGGFFAAIRQHGWAPGLPAGAM